MKTGTGMIKSVKQTGIGFVKYLKIPITIVPVPTATKSTACGGDLEWYLYTNGKCYYVTSTYEERKSWQHAREFCNLNGADLVSIHSQDEQELIVSAVSISSHWSDGSPLDYTYWADGEPNDFNGEEQCAELRQGDGKWNDQNCGDKLAFICMKNVGAIEPVTNKLTTQHPLSSCPVGFLEHGNKCYSFNGGAGDTTDWNDARDRCRNAGGDLATIHSQEQQAFLTSNLRDISYAMWIGLTDMTTENYFKWTDGSPRDYFNWAVGEPNGGNEENCVEMHFRGYGGYWNDALCTSTAGYICQGSKGPQNPVQPTTPNYCRPGYQQYWNGCYRPFTGSYTYNQARSQCQQENAELVSIVDVYEQAYVEYHMLLSGQTFWIGLNDIQSEGVYKWSDGTPVMYTYWGPDEPSRDIGGGCVVMSADGTWDDTLCSLTAGGICKYWTAPQPTTPFPGEGSCFTNSSWTKYGGYCYHFSNSQEQTSWPEASYECERLGGYLVTIESEAENDYIQTTLQENSMNVWIGLNRNLQGGFEWVDRKPVSYTKWADGEPNGLTTGEDCGEMYFSSGEWNDVDCSWRVGFVCKMQQGDGNLSSGAIVGIIFGVIAAIVIIVFMVLAYLSYSGKASKFSLNLPSMSSLYKSSNNESSGGGFDNVSYSTSKEQDTKIGFNMDITTDA
ncbi:macrophage mannose receptor 1-like [Glandiceps talaboti]